MPSVVLGFFALAWIAPNVVGSLFGEENGRGGSMLAAGIGVGILTIPLVASVSEDAMRAVPQSLREASAGLGARRMATTVRVVLPAAVSGLVAAFILAVSRAIGETMVVFIAAGAATVGNYSTNPLDSGPDHDGRRWPRWPPAPRACGAPASPTRACSWWASSCSSSRWR